MSIDQAIAVMAVTLMSSVHKILPYNVATKDRASIDCRQYSIFINGS